MALIKCIECGKEISDKAEHCPNCGCPSSLQIKESEDAIQPKIIDPKWQEIQDLVNAGDGLSASFMVRNLTKLQYYKACEIVDYMEKHGTPPEYLINPNFNNPNALVPCPACKRMISKQTETCPGCGKPTGIHVCPNCGSINTRTISELSKATSVFMWGAFAANRVKSTFECLDCKQKF